MDDNWHVYPLEDLREHNTTGLSCECNPRMERQEDGWLIVHNSYDGREYHEEDSLKYQKIN